MLYGEVFADDIDPPCGENPSQPACVTGNFALTLKMYMYTVSLRGVLTSLLERTSRNFSVCI